MTAQTHEGAIDPAGGAESGERFEGGEEGDGRAEDERAGVAVVCDDDGDDE